MPILVLLPVTFILNFAIAWQSKGISRIGNALAGAICLLIWVWYMGELVAFDF